MTVLLSLGFLALGALLGAAGIFLPGMAAVYRRSRIPKIVRCPEAREVAAVEVSARRAAMGLLTGDRTPQITGCSLWPLRGDCDRGCTRRLGPSASERSLETILSRWTEGKGCAMCTRPFEGLETWLNQPAVLAPDGTTHEWCDIPSADVPIVLATHRPICWGCHITESFRHAGNG